MASVLKVLLAFLRKLYPSENYIKRFARHLALFLAFLGRRFSVCLRSWHGESGATRRKSTPIEPPSPCATASSRTVSHDSAGLRENLVACSTVPTSMSVPSLQDPDRETRQQTTATPSGGAILPPDGRTPANLSSTNLSIHSSASDRHNIITHSLESLHIPVDRPSRLARATHCEPGQGQDTTQSIERQSRSESSPTDDLYDRTIPSISHAVPSVVIDVLNPTTELLPTSSSTNPQGPQQLTDESYVIGSPPTRYLSLHVTAEGSSQHLPPASLIMPDIRLPEGCTLLPIHSGDVPRYERIKIPKVKTFYQIGPLTITFPYFQEQGLSDQPSLNQDYSPWAPATHPDGTLYFFDCKRRLFTDTDMHNSFFRKEMEIFYLYLQNILHANQLTIPSNNYDLVLHIMPIEHSTGRKWSYYYACHETRCLFWLHTYDATDMISEVFGAKSPAHIKHQLEYLYWRHWSRYPAVFGGRSLPISVYDELIGMLSYGCAEKITSSNSPVEIDVDKMEKMIEIVKNAKDAKSGLEYHVAAIVRFLVLFTNWRFIDFHGEPYARPGSGQAVYSEPNHERSLRFKLLSLLLFLAPDNHLRDIEILSTDGHILLTAWESFMNELVQGWTDVLLPSTVMLSATVGFLVIPGVILSNLNESNPNQFIIFTSPAQIASTLSIVASVGSIMIDQLLIRYTSTKLRLSSASQSAYQFQRPQRLFGDESMAIVVSLPWALLMWSMVLFFIALLLSCFTHSNASTRISVAVMSFMVACLTVWSILTTWRSDDDWEELDNRLAELKRVDHRILARVKHFTLSTFTPGWHRAHPTPYGPVTEHQDRSA